jgi:hypothetical protein
LSYPQNVWSPTVRRYCIRPLTTGPDEPAPGEAAGEQGEGGAEGPGASLLGNGTAPSNASRAASGGGVRLGVEGATAAGGGKGVPPAEAVAVGLVDFVDLPVDPNAWWAGGGACMCAHVLAGYEGGQGEGGRGAGGSRAW